MAAEVSHPLLDSARPHDPALVAKAIAGGKKASSASASGVGGTSLSTLLSSASLSHLDDILQGVTLDDLQMRLASDRPAFLTYLKRLGVEKLGDRQATANAITKAENSGLLQASTGISYMKPCTWEEHEDQSTITVTLLVPADTTSNQLKMKCDANSLHVEYRGERTSACGKLFDTVKAADCLWELERSPRPEYDPLADAAEQPSSGGQDGHHSRQGHARALARPLQRPRRQEACSASARARAREQDDRAEEEECDAGHRLRAAQVRAR